MNEMDKSECRKEWLNAVWNERCQTSDCFQEQEEEKREGIQSLRRWFACRWASYWYLRKVLSVLKGKRLLVHSRKSRMGSIEPPELDTASTLHRAMTMHPEVYLWVCFPPEFRPLIFNQNFLAASASTATATPQISTLSPAFNPLKRPASVVSMPAGGHGICDPPTPTICKFLFDRLQANSILHKLFAQLGQILLEILWGSARVGWWNICCLRRFMAGAAHLFLVPALLAPPPPKLPPLLSLLLLFSRLFLILQTTLSLYNGKPQRFLIIKLGYPFLDWIFWGVIANMVFDFLKTFFVVIFASGLSPKPGPESHLGWWEWWE